MATWTKLTKATLSDSSYGWGTQAWGTSPYGGQAGRNWTKLTKGTDSWTKLTKGTDSWTKLTKAS